MSVQKNEALIAALKQDPLFQLLPKQTQSSISSRLTIRQYFPQQPVYGFDDTPVGLYFLFEGGLRVE